MVLLMPGIAAELNRVAPLLPADVVAQRQIRIKVSAAGIHNIWAREAKARGDISLAGDAVVDSLRTEESVGIEIAYVQMVQEVRRYGVVGPEGKNVAVSRRSRIFLLKEWSRPFPWILTVVMVFDILPERLKESFLVSV